MKERGLKGTIEMFVTEPNGKKRLVQKHSNTVMYPVMTKLALNLVTDQDMVLGNLFVANTQPPVNSEDGIDIGCNFIQSNTGTKLIPNLSANQYTVKTVQMDF